MAKIRMSLAAKMLNIPYEELMYHIKQKDIECYRRNKKARPYFYDSHLEKAKEFFFNKKNGIKKDKINSTILVRLNEEEDSVIENYAHLLKTSKSSICRNFITSGKLDHSIFDYMEQSFEDNNLEKQSIKKIINLYFQQHGFPYSKINDEHKINIMKNLINRDFQYLLNDQNELRKNQYGTNLANIFHPHMMEVKIGSRPSPKEYFDKNGVNDNIIDKIFDLGKFPNISRIRSMIRIISPVRCAGNFKPSIAKFIYSKYCNDNDKVLDPCAGFSGRLIGCIATDKNLHYHGIDPEMKTAVGNIKCADFFKDKVKFDFNFYNEPAEIAMERFQNNYFNLIFTSPPYFNLEKYSTNNNQSYIKFPEYENWLENFLFKILKESRRTLKNDGRLIINIKNIKGYNILDDLISNCGKYGFEIEKTYKMIIATSEFQRNNPDKINKTEPILVFKPIAIPTFS